MKLKKHLSILAAAAALFAAGTASAGVVGFAINGTYSQGVSQPEMFASIGLGGAGSFTLDPGGSNLYFDFQRPGGGTFSTIDSAIYGYYFLRSYSAGDVIGDGNFGDHVSVNGDWDSILVENNTRGAWDASHEGFLGFRTASGNYGYIEYDYTRVNSVSTISFLSGAYESSAGVAIQTPGAAAVPEPAGIALLGLGALGLLGARRKQAKR
jgi:hypothetical protein